MTPRFARAVCTAIMFYAATVWADSPAPAAMVIPVPHDLAPSAMSAGAPSATSFRYPETGNHPSSTLRVREITIPTSTEAVAHVFTPVTDTLASVQAYQRCQPVGTHAATDNVDMRGRIAQCLAELDARRQTGR